MLNKLILVLNCGSSSIKFSVLDPCSGFKHLWGEGLLSILNKSKIIWNYRKLSFEKFFDKKVSYEVIIRYIFENILLKKSNKIVKEIIGIGHRVVHGGDVFKNSVIINKDVMNSIKKLFSLAPLHNPNNYLGIKLSIDFFNTLKNKNVAVFDTSFYKTLKEEAYLYAIPYEFYRQHKIRRYGAHGISHQYISNQVIDILNKPKNSLNIISCHLGSGSSVAAIKNGVCVDISMGFTPLEGLVMGTRSGDIDPSIIFFMSQQLKYSINKISNILNKQSGLIGLTKNTGDCRYAVNNYYYNEFAKRAVDIFCYRLSKYIGSYFILMDKKLDALVFTGGIGENSSFIRKLTISKLSMLGLYLNNTLNKVKKSNNNFLFINKTKTTPILVILANEELEIAKETIYLINQK